MSRAVWIAGAAAILPLAAISAAETPPSAGAFKPPTKPLILTRTLRHLLHDGKAVVTRRSYRVQFAAEGNGYRLSGALAEVTVEAPPGLEALAALERQRPDPGLFPIRLGADGMIRPAADPAPSRQQRQAIGTASADIARMDLASADAAERRASCRSSRRAPIARRGRWTCLTPRVVPGASSGRSRWIAARQAR